MKKAFLFLSIILIAASGWAQSPDKMSYQAVVRDSKGELVMNQPVGIRISIIQGTVNGNIVYSELQSPTTNENGLVTLEIGTGVTGNDFASIDWAQGPYFIKTEIDPTGGTSYTITGTNQLLSVPYALYAETAEKVAGGFNETDPVYNASVASEITASDTTKWNSKLDNYTESDPVYEKSVASNISAVDTTRWHNKLDSYTETDPVYGISVASNITASDTTNWNNKLSRYTETDPIYAASVAENISAADTTRWGSYIRGIEYDPVFKASVVANITAADTTRWHNKVESSSLALVATSGNYSDLSNRPTLASVATSGSYTDLTNKPALATVATSGNYSDLIGKPILATVATSGSYNDLSNKPTLATVATSGKYYDLTGTPALAAVATSGSYNDLSNKPSLATVATSGDYNDLTNKPFMDGSETKINGGTNVTVTGSGTSTNPYVVNASSPTIRNVSTTTTLTSSDEIVFCSGGISGPTYIVYLPPSPYDGQTIKICSNNQNVSVDDTSRSIYILGNEHVPGSTVINFGTFQTSVLIFIFSSSLNAWCANY